MPEVIRVKNDPATNRATAPENKLHRPKINFALSALFPCALLAVAVTCSILLALVLRRVGLISAAAARFVSQCLLLSPFILAALTLATLKHPCIFAIRVYQRYADSQIRLRCCQTPSCSNYGILAIQKYGAVRGIWMMIGRLRRCNPPGCVDYP